MQTYVAGDDSERELWAALGQHPIEAGTRLVVVRNAEKLKSLSRIAEWASAKAKNPRTHVIFVSNSPTLDRETQTLEQRKTRTKGALLPHLQAISGKGSLIECRPFTQATAKHAVTWVESKVEIRRGVAGHLLNRANGDLRLVRDAVRKLKVFPDEVSEEVVDLLFSERPRNTFVDALLELDKPTALLALEYLPQSEYSSTIGLLDQRLEVVGTVHDMLISHHSMSQITAQLGTMGFLAKDLVPIAKSYDPKRRLALRKNLAVADEAVRGGVTEGPLEALVNFW
jgi:DNA polymerase III delta subunit